MGKGWQIEAGIPCRRLEMTVAKLFCKVGTMDPHKMFAKFLELLQEIVL